MSHNLLTRILDESGAYQAAGRHLSQGEWRSPLMVDELAEISPAALQSTWLAQTNWTYGDQPVDDGRPAPIFVSGWPGSGREALLPALLSAAASKRSPVWPKRCQPRLPKRSRRR